MSRLFSANQYEDEYKPRRLGNWEAQQVCVAQTLNAFQDGIDLLLPQYNNPVNVWLVIML
jgi:hypothetical protein